MSKQNLQFGRKQQVQHQREATPWRYGVMALICGLFLIGGFFWAAKQHFSVIDLAIKNAKLRREKEVLESEQRRLFLTREIALSPAEIKKAAQKIGLQDLTPENIEIMMPDRPTEALPAGAVDAFLKQSATPIPIVEPEAADDKANNPAGKSEVKKAAKSDLAVSKKESAAGDQKTVEKNSTVKKDAAEKTDKKDTAVKKTDEKTAAKKKDEKKTDGAKNTSPVAAKTAATAKNIEPKVKKQ